MPRAVAVKEKYHYFHRLGITCRLGVYGLTWDYFPIAQPLPTPPEKIINLAIPDPTIRTMQAVVTSRCNLNCTYCSFFANTPDPPSQIMSADDLDWCVQYFNNEIGEKGLLLITGGEPELYPKAVNYLCENTVGTKVLFTNGTLITAARLRYYQQHNINLIFSLDGDLFAQDAVRRGASGSYNQVANGLHLAHTLGLNFGISAVVGDHNIERLPELVGYIHGEFQPQSLGLNLPHIYGENRWLRIEEYTDALIEIFDYASQTGLFVDQLNRRLSPLINGQFRFRDCAAQGEKVVIYPGGGMTSCVNEGALTDRTVAWKERMPIGSDQCRDCFAIGSCGGGCIFDGEKMYGCGHFDERNCHYTQKLLEHFLWDFYDRLGPLANDRVALQKEYGTLLYRSQGTRFSVGHET